MPQAFVATLFLLCGGQLRAQTNGVVRELYSNLSGSSLPDLTNAVKFPGSPDAMFLESAFEAPSNFSDNYGQRMRALVCPPVTGSYTFYIASDDNSMLYLSTDEDPVHKVGIAYESSWNGVRAWNTYTSQKSAPITLTAGKRYYIEALQKEGGGGDNLAVTWQKPGDAAPADGAAPIPGAYLVPYGLAPPVVKVQPANVTVVEAGSATFSVQLAQTVGALYQWTRNGVAIAGATNSWHVVSPATLADNGALFGCAITNFCGSTNSSAATLTVTADITPPTMVSASTLGEPQIVNVVFSEPVEPASATNTANYSIANGVTVLAAAFGLDARSVVLTVTPLAPNTNYLLTVNNVRDRAVTPNAIAPNSQLYFSTSMAPLDISYARPYPEPISASSRHGPVIISEIMYHPPGRADGKNLEYIELFNSNPWTEDIGGFRLAGEVEYTFATNAVIAARNSLVVAAAPADLQSVWGSMAVVGPYTNSLANRSGTLRLCNREGGIVFEVSYSSRPPWPAAADGGGHSLVLGWPSLGEANPAAWTASAFIGGSPGRAEATPPAAYRTVLINEVLAHTDPPDYDYIELYNYSNAELNLGGCILSDDPATNKYSFPTNCVIGPQGFVVVDERQLGFRLDAGGETVYFKDPTNTRVLDCLRFGAQENGVSFGRCPDGGKDFTRLQAKTPGAPNSRARVADVVLNEIMYAPISGSDDDQYVELYNRTAAPVDVGRWSFEDGISYTIPAGAVIPGSGFLVVAKNAAHLMTNYANLDGANTVGNFSGTLARGGEHLALAMPDELVGTNAAGIRYTNHIHIVVDEVTYGTGGRWGKWAHGGGSSLELIDAHSDHRLAPNWADSDESHKSGWTTIQVTDVLDNGNGTADSLQIIMLGPGECLVDNVEVFSAGTTNRVTNPDFESGLNGWYPQGNHEDSSWEPAEGYNSAHSLHVRATDHGDTGANRIRTTLTAPLSAGQTATIRARVRWLAGSPEILFRLHGNWLEATGNMLRSASLGTPGAPNSRAVANAGPAITDVKHTPVLPVGGQAVTISARVNDPDGLAGLFLKYRLDPATNFNILTMNNNGAGLYSATIPSQALGRIVAFYIEALDNNAARATARFPADAPARECLVRWGDPSQGPSFATYRVWMTQATFNRWSTREHLSNRPLDCTFVYGSSRAIYNMGGQYSGSPWHAPGYNTPTGNVCDYLLTFPEDDPLLGETDATLQWPGNGGGDNTYQREQTAYWIGEQIGLPYCYRRLVNLYINGTRRAEMFEDVQQPNGNMDDEYYPRGKNGDLHKVQIWYEFDDAASTFLAAGAALGNVTTTGGQKEKAFYRWTFAKRAAHGSANDYTNLFGLVDAANWGGLGPAYRRQLEAKVDVDNWLKTYAVEHIVGNNDSFAYGGGQNLYIYKPVADTWKTLIWDIDFAFTSLAPDSDPFQGIGRSNGIDLGEPGYKRRYWEILQDLANGPLNGVKLGALVDGKYTAMVSNGRTVDSPVSIKTYVSQRRASLLNLIATNAASAFSITLNGGAGFSTGQNYLWLQGLAPIDVRTITINGVAFPLTWSSATAWSAPVALAPGVNILLVQGWGPSSNAVTGATATITITNNAAGELPQDKLAINEIMYHPAAPEASFVEIRNTSTLNGFDLSGYRLNGADFIFPGGTVVAPNSYLVVAGNTLGFRDAYGPGIPLAGEFKGKLDNGGETLQLIQPGLAPQPDVVIDEVKYDSRLPWPAAADGGGASLQLIDANQDNNRVANWAAVATNAPGMLAPYTPGGANSVRATLPRLPGLWLNEVLPNNLTGATDRFGHRHSWAELYNNGPTNLSLAGMFLANNYSNLLQWPFPDAAAVGAGQRVLVWVDGNPGEAVPGEWHTSFMIPPDVGSLVLVSTNGGRTNILDYLNYALTQPDRSYGAFPDGSPSRRQVFYFPTPRGTNNPASPPLNVFINEWMADNKTTIADPADNNFEDWFELYNAGDAAADLAGFYLGQTLTNRTKFRIPAGYVIPAGGRLLVWADDETGQNSTNYSDLHVNFKLSKDGDAIGLFAPDGTVIDFVSFGPQGTDSSQGRYPDGSSAIVPLTIPTPGLTNYLLLPNTPPAIGAISNCVIFEGQLLTASVTASDTDYPAQKLTFSLPGGAPAGVGINADTGLFSWRPAADQAPGTYVLNVCVTDDGVPPMSAATTFTVQVVSRPKVTSLRFSARGNEISFVTVPNKSYQVQYKDSLLDADWLALGAPTIATGESLTLIDLSGGAQQRFYRVVAVE